MMKNYLMYSDNFALIDLKNLEKTHKKNNKIITLSVVKKILVILFWMTKNNLHHIPHKDLDLHHLLK